MGLTWVRAAAETAEGGGVPTCMYLLGAMGTALVVVTTALVKAVSVAWNERNARIADREAAIAKLEEVREARDTTRAMRDRERNGSAQ